ncbi:hypothetical protein EUGRSUZ_C01727 [Eucalyptus grandis]|uniref:Uncharacterized protein n=2 Tax=Eucalyptus grandis TaxID=71139 RepID=A0A059CR02_EUCGR|nr:hypothetical protein EUGRSUZ_C01727 [Eucalyptus grandis]
MPSMNQTKTGTIIVSYSPHLFFILSFILVIKSSSDSQNFPNLLDYLEVYINVLYLKLMLATHVQLESRCKRETRATFTKLSPPAINIKDALKEGLLGKKKSRIAQMCTSRTTYNPNSA